MPIPRPGYEERDDKRIYVWFDAVIGYLSAAVEWAAIRGTPDAWREWWQNPDARHYYFMGKDNIVFHTVIWPSMLLGYGEGGELGAAAAARAARRHRRERVPDDGGQAVQRPAGGWRSTSATSSSRYDPDPLRYFLTAAGPETQDTDFTWAEFVRRNNDELVANWGNLVNRTLTIAYRNFGEVSRAGRADRRGPRLLAARSSAASRRSAADRAGAVQGRARRGDASGRLVNQYLSEQAPWALIESDRERAARSSTSRLRAIDSLKALFTPFLPFSSQGLHELLGYEGTLAGPLELREVGTRTATSTTC